MNYLSLLMITYGTLFGLGLIDNSRGALYPQILETLNVGPAFGSWMFTAASIAGVICTLMNQLWLRKFGPIISLRIFLFIQFVGTVIFSFAGTSPQPFSYFALIIASVLIGSSFGGLGIVLNIIISKEVPEKFRKRALSGLHASYGASSFFAPLLALLLVVNGHIHWNELFLYYSFVPLVMFASSFVLAKSFSTAVIIVGPNVQTSKLKYLLSLFVGFYVAGELSVSTRLVYFASKFSSPIYFNPKTYLAIFFLLLLIGRASFFFFHFPGSNWFWLNVSLLTSFVLYTLGLYVDPLYMAMCGFTMSIFFPCFMDFINQKVAKELLEKTIGLVMITIGVVVISMNWLIGYLEGSVGVISAMSVGPLFLAVSFFLGLIFYQFDNSKNN